MRGPSEAILPQRADRCQEVLDYVAQNSGVTIQDVATAVGICHTSAAYHLSNLHRRGEVKRIRQGRALIHFMAAVGASRGRLLHWARDERRGAIIACLAKDPARVWPLNEFARELGVYHGFLHRALHSLAEDHLVQVNRVGNRYFVQATPQFLRFLAESPLPLAIEVPAHSGLVVPGR